MTTTAERTQELKEQQAAKKRPIDAARERLILLSAEVRDMVEDGMFDTVNAAIMETMYKDKTHRVFDTFMGWKLKGKKVKKGEKAFILWSKPKNLEKKEPEPTPEDTTEETHTPEDETFKFFGIAYLFSNAQVEDISLPEPEPEKVETEPLPELVYD